VNHTKPIPEKRESILHVQNVFLSGSIPIYIARETQKYVIGYELKNYRIHYLMFKIDRRLLNKVENPIKINTAIDINVREDFRNSLKSSDPNSTINGKNVTIRIIPTRYDTIPPLYAIFYQFQWRETGTGGLDELNYEISECPIISNSSTINDICYKRVARQVSFGGTHGIHTYLLVSPHKGKHTVGKWVRATNVNWGGHRHVYVNPVTISI